MPENHTHQFAYAATVGFFDGVHAGHRFLIDELKSEAQKNNLLSLIITFKLHPRRVLNDAFQPQLLTDPDEKKKLLTSTGVDKVIELDFTPEMAKLSAKDFIIQVLSAQFNVKLLLVGHDHRFGHNREKGFPDYVAYGKQIEMQVIQATRYFTKDFSHISSSTIREALQKGNIETANALLSYPYTFSGFVVNGFKVGKKIGFPTANLQPIYPHKLIPGLGVYVVYVEWHQTNYIAMMNIGTRPTLANGNNISIEVHILNFHDDIYHKNINVTFLKKIRNEKKFNSVEALIKQLQLDRQFVMNFVGQKT